MEIRRLDEKTIQKIAAGEVVERPASIVKELVENAIDAKATEISLEIVDGGIQRISVSDNGVGIEEDFIELAFERHATSKISEFEDLYNILSLGFRGEALASIAAVTDVEMYTKTEKASMGTRIFLEKGEIVKRTGVGMNRGTTVIARDLFARVPVRKKFLRSSQTETNAITGLMYRLAIGNPDVAFKYTRDDKLVFQTHGTGDVLETLLIILGKDLYRHLIPIEGSTENMKVRGFLSTSNYYRGNRSMQFLFVNGRSVHSADVDALISDQYRRLIPMNRYPAVFLFLDIDPSQIDINIHPGKQQIAFAMKEEVLRFLEDLIHRTLHERMVPGNVSENEPKRIPRLYDSKNQTSRYEKLLSTYRGSDGGGAEKKTIEKRKPFELRNRWQESPSTVKEETKPYPEPSSEKNLLEQENSLPYDVVLGYVFDGYILVSWEREDLAIIHQGRAHERILYEEMTTRKETLVIQPLLVPCVVDLNDREYEQFLESKEKLFAAGFEIDEFGERSVALRGVPSAFTDAADEQLVHVLLDEGKIKDASEEEFRNRLIKRALYRAVPTKKKLSPPEIDALLKNLFQTKKPYVSPHGQRIVTRMTKTQWERLFEKGF